MLPMMCDQLPCMNMAVRMNCEWLGLLRHLNRDLRRQSNRISKFTDAVCFRGPRREMTPTTVAAQECSSSTEQGRQFKVFPAREVKLGSLTVMRALPIRQRRLIGPWC